MSVLVSGMLVGGITAFLVFFSHMRREERGCRRRPEF